MRKSEIVYKVRNYYDLLNIVNGTDKTYAATLYKVVDNWGEISLALHRLNEFDFMGNSVLDLFNLGPNFQSYEDKLLVAERDYSKFIKLFDIVKAKCVAILDFYSFDTKDNNLLYMKLPGNLYDLKELSDMIGNLEKAFNLCPIMREKAGTLKFERVEEGSNWLVLSIVTAAAGTKALDWFASFITKCNEIRIQNRTIANLDLDIILKRFKINEKEFDFCKKNYSESENEEIRDACISKFKEISEDVGEVSNEDEGRITLCMKTLIDVLERGAEFYPSSDASEETKNLFPKKTEFKMLENDTKYLVKDDEDNN